MDRPKPRTYNELIFNSFEHKEEGESNVKLNRIKEKLWCGPSQLPVQKR